MNMQTSRPATIAAEVKALAAVIRSHGRKAAANGSRIDNVKMYAEDYVAEHAALYPRLSTCKTDWLSLLKKELGL